MANNKTDLNHGGALMGAVVEFKPRCCICGRRMQRYEGNNPYPIREDGLCCSACNNDVVVPARIDAVEQWESQR